MIRSEISESAASAGICYEDAAARSDVLLARIFLACVLGAGLVSCLFGLAPESMALLPCPLHLVTGLECPGCGMTRACIALCRGALVDALHYNPISIFLFLLAAAFALAPGRTRRNWVRLAPGTRRITKWAALAAVLVFWICRNLR